MNSIIVEGVGGLVDVPPSNPLNGWMKRGGRGGSKSRMKKLLKLKNRREQRQFLNCHSFNSAK